MHEFWVIKVFGALIPGRLIAVFMSKSYFVVLISLILILTSCGQAKKNAQLAEEAELDSIMNEQPDTLELFDDVEPPKAVDELFDDFFFTFASDARFQNQRIRFPLRFSDENAEIRLSKTDWSNYNRFGQQEFYSVIYEREEDLALQKDTAVHEVSVQWIYLQDRYVEKFNFKRIPEGQWVLFNIEKQDIGDTPNGEFVGFYSKFVADSVYQRSCLQMPLRIKMTQDGEEEETEEAISADSWFEMSSDMPMPKDIIVNIDYGQQCTESHKKNVLMEGVSNGLFMEYKFEKVSGDWKLIGIVI